MSESPQFNRLKQCRHGLMVYNIHDTYVGASLEHYGEYSEEEILLFEQFVRPGQLILEIGANVGALTVPLAKMVGPTGSIWAFEPQRIIHQTLCANVALNSITDAYCCHAAVGAQPGSIVVPYLDYTRENNFGGISLRNCDVGESVPVVTVDGLNLPSCALLKIDVEGMEKDVLEGAINTITTHWPALYVENDRVENSEALVRYIDSLGYNMYWHRPPLFNPNNFAGNPVNIFGNVLSHNMLCLPKHIPQEMSDFQRVEVPTAPGLMDVDSSQSEEDAANASLTWRPG